MDTVVWLYIQSGCFRYTSMFEYIQICFTVFKHAAYIAMQIVSFRNSKNLEDIFIRDCYQLVDHHEHCLD